MIEGIATEPKQTFWIYTINMSADLAAIEWCKVFGSWDEATHWTNVVPKDQQAVVRAELLARLQMTHGDWGKYWRSIDDYRNQIVAHHDLDAVVRSNPHYDVALSRRRRRGPIARPTWSAG